MEVYLVFHCDICGKGQSRGMDFDQLPAQKSAMPKDIFGMTAVGKSYLCRSCNNRYNELLNNQDNQRKEFLEGGDHAQGNIARAE